MKSIYSVVGFYNRDEKCLQRGTDWVFKLSILQFVFHGLRTSHISVIALCDIEYTCVQLQHVTKNKTA